MLHSSDAAPAMDLSLVQLWHSHKAECRPLGPIMADARAGRLPGVEPIGNSFKVTDEATALEALRASPFAGAA